MKGNAIVKTGLYFGIITGLFLALSFGILLGISFQDGIYGLCWDWDWVWPWTCLQCFLQLHMAFLSSTDKKFEPLRRKMAREHRIVLEGGANHFMNREGVGGWLFNT